MANPNLQRLIQQALYSLKRDYGQHLTVFQGVPTANVTTGVVTRNVTSYRIHRGIVLPVKVLEAVKTLTSGGLAGRLNIVGSHYESGKRLFIIDRRDISVVMTMDDWIKYDNRKYTFESLEEYEFHTAYLVVGVELVGESSIGVESNVSVTSTLALDQGATGVL